MLRTSISRTALRVAANVTRSTSIKSNPTIHYPTFNATLSRPSFASKQPHSRHFTSTTNPTNSNVSTTSANPTQEEIQALKNKVAAIKAESDAMIAKPNPEFANKPFNHLDTSELDALRTSHSKAMQELSASIKDLSVTEQHRIIQTFQHQARKEEKELMRRQTQQLYQQIREEGGRGSFTDRMLGLNKIEELQEKHMAKNVTSKQDDATNDPRSLRGMTALVVLTIVGIIGLKMRETETIASAKVVSYQVAGKLDIGGDFYNLIDQYGSPADSTQYHGKYYPLIYFGFTNCPDICPTELTKMMKALDIIEERNPDVYRHIKPIFISVDPLRDTQQRLLEYSAEFHPRIRWLTGTYDNLLEVAKKYRVYFSIPEDATPDSDYNVDHSIFFFLMDRDGQLLNYYGQNKTAQDIADAMANVITEDFAREQLMNSPQLPPQKQ